MTTHTGIALDGNLVTQLADTINTLTAPYRTQIEGPFKELSKPFYGLVDDLAGKVGFGSDLCIVMIFLWLSYPLGILHRFVPTRFLRHLTSLILGVTITFLVYGWQAMHALVVATVVYAAIVVLPAKLAAGFSFFFAFAYLSICHIYRMSTDYLGWSMDFSALMMLVTLKVISVSFNVYDGKQNEESLGRTHKERMLKKVPNPLEYFAYLYFFPAVISGPVYDIRHYLDFIEKPGPFSPLTILNRIMWALIATAVFLGGGKFYLSRDPFLAPYIHSVPYVRRLIDALLAVYFNRHKYYAGWAWAEGGCIAAGFGYSEVEDKMNMKYPWTRVDQADYIGVEFASDIRNVTNNWNKNVSRWLFNYVYTRVTSNPKKQVGGSQKSAVSAFQRLFGLLATFTVSAFWHGFYGGYYQFWIFMAISNQAHQLWNAKITPRILNERRRANEQFTNFYTVFCIIASLSCVGYFACSFSILSWTETVEFYNSFYWAGHILCVGLFVLGLVFPPYRAPKTEEKPKAQ